MYVLTMNRPNGKQFNGLFKTLEGARSYLHKEMRNTDSVVSAGIVFVPVVEGGHD